MIKVNLPRWEGRSSKPDHPSSYSYNVSDRDVDYDISAELTLNHPETKRRIYAQTLLSQQRAWEKSQRTLLDFRRKPTTFHFTE